MSGWATPALGTMLVPGIASAIDDGAREGASVRVNGVYVEGGFRF